VNELIEKNPDPDKQIRFGVPPKHWSNSFPSDALNEGERIWRRLFTDLMGNADAQPAL
jgi:hypothetical protein